MAVGVPSWSTTASSNASADSNINYAEGQAPSTLNNSARAMMAALKAYFDGIGGAATYGGSSSDYTITNAATGAWSSYAAGQVIALKANHTSDDTAVNVNVDGLGNKRVKTCDGGDPQIGDLVSGGIYLLAYDGTNFQILNTIAGGAYQPLDALLTALAALTTAADKMAYFTDSDLVALTDLTASARGMLGQSAWVADARTLKVQGTSATEVTVTSDRIAVFDSNGAARVLTAVSEVADITASGAGGLDTGSEATSTWYAVHLIYNPTTADVAAMLSTSRTSPTLPSGYTFWRFLGWVRNDSSGNLWRTVQLGNRAHIDPTTNPSNYPQMSSGNTSNVATAVAWANFAPPSAAAIFGRVSPGSGSGFTAIGAVSGVYLVTALAGLEATAAEIPLLSSNIYWISNHANADTRAVGWVEGAL